MNKIFGYIDLKAGEEEKQKVLDNVKANTSFRGSNLWILACAIVVASVGLNVNSTSVIIGAMLISPLMGPIVGAGFSLGTYDFALLRKSLKNLLIATLVSLSVATLYFLLSPFKETQSELLSRTSPNIYDVIIAFFGGLVGVIAITRVEKGNPIPGVAIATALMPPLCTAGYGLAIGNLRFFAGALFLYTINCVFICIATFLIVKYLNYPAQKQKNDRIDKQIRYAITVLIVIMIVPSSYLAYKLLNEKKYNQQVDHFIENEFTVKGYTLIHKKISTTGNSKKIELAFLTKKFTPNELLLLNEDLKKYQLTNTQLIIKQDTTDIRNIIQKEINGTKSYIDEKDLKIADLQKQIDASYYNNAAILAEVKILFPGIETLSIANHSFAFNKDSAGTIPVLLYKSNARFTKTDEEKMIAWLQQKLNKSNLQAYPIQ